jgi:hypothetical protein
LNANAERDKRGVRILFTDFKRHAIVLPMPRLIEDKRPEAKSVRRGGRRPGAGRKRSTIRTGVVSVRLPAKRIAQLRAAAKRRHCSLSQLLEGMLGKAVVLREHKFTGPVIDVEGDS